MGVVDRTDVIGVSAGESKRVLERTIHLVGKKLPSTHKALVPDGRPLADSFEVMFAVVSRSTKPLADALPFFSRLNLRNRARTLRGLGCKVSLTKIRMA